jgi:hypothetical protein
MPAVFGCDAHKQFSVFVVIDGKGKTSPPVRVEHHRREYVAFLHTLPPESEVALEATGHWYWMVDEMEKAATARIWPTQPKQRSAWARPTRLTLSTPSCCTMTRCPRAGFLSRSPGRGDRAAHHRRPQAIARSSAFAHGARHRRDPCAARLAGGRKLNRFPRTENLASYAGLVPRILASGGRIRHGGTCRNINQYLKLGLRRGRHLCCSPQGVSRKSRRATVSPACTS